MRSENFIIYLSNPISLFPVSEPHPGVGGQVQRGGEPSSTRATAAGGDGHSGGGAATAFTTG